MLRLSIASGLLFTGCALIPGYGNLMAKSAANPLKGEPIVLNEAPEGLPFTKGEQLCTIWPIENSFRVTATDSEICLDATVHKLRQPQFGASGSEGIDVASDGTMDSNGGVVATPARQRFEARPHKIGTCTDDTRGTQSIWVSEYKGCVPNADGLGKPVLTKRSTFLEIGGKRWKFPAPTEGPATGAPTVSSTTAAK